MIRINQIQFDVFVDDNSDTDYKGVVDVKACLESKGIDLKDIDVEIDNKLLYETNEERDFKIDHENSTFTYELVGDIEDLPNFISVDVILHPKEDTGQVD